MFDSAVLTDPAPAANGHAFSFSLELGPWYWRRRLKSDLGFISMSISRPSRLLVKKIRLFSNINRRVVAESQAFVENSQ